MRLISAPQPDPAGAPPFQWSDVAAADRDWLRKRTDDVESLSYRVGCDFARLGKLLAEVRERLPRGTFVAWLDAETPFSRAHAYRLLAVGEAFGGYISQIEKIEPAALYLLASPAVPAPIRAHAVQLASGQEPVTRAVALQLIEAHKVRAGKADESQADERNRATKEQRKADAKALGPIVEESPERLAERQQKTGAAMLALVADCTMVHVSKIDEDEDDPLYSVMCYRENDRPRNTIRRELLPALQAALSPEAEDAKRCPKCESVKTLSEFGSLHGVAGAARCCRVCERTRVSGAKRRSKARKKAKQTQPAAAPDSAPPL